MSATLRAMDGSPLDDVFDVLEGALDELIRTRGFALDSLDRQGSAIRGARAAVAVLSALMRAGHGWRPAEDGHEAPVWRDIMLAALDDPAADAPFITLVRRELEEFVTLAAATTGPRRELPPAGSFERLARRAGVQRDDCIFELRDVEDDHVAGWARCADPRWLARIPVALGTPIETLVRTVCTALANAAPESSATARELLESALTGAALDSVRAKALSPPDDGTENPYDNAAWFVLEAMREPDVISLEHAIATTLEVIDLAELRDRMTTLPMRTRLSHPERFE